MNVNFVEDEEDSSIELELDFDKSKMTIEEDEDEKINPDDNPTNFQHVKDIDKLNDSLYLDDLEDQPAILRKKKDDG